MPQGDPFTPPSVPTPDEDTVKVRAGTVDMVPAVGVMVIPAVDTTIKVTEHAVPPITPTYLLMVYITPPTATLLAKLRRQPHIPPQPSRHV